MSEVKPDYGTGAIPTQYDLLLMLIREVASMRLALEAVRTDLATLLAEREPEPRPLRAGGGRLYWPRTTEGGG